MAIQMNVAELVPGRVRRWVLGRNIKQQPRDDLIWLGSPYGGWAIPSSMVVPTSVCYCAGVGEDISFDIELITRFGCKVHAFDPTPEAHQHVESLAHVPDLFVLHRYGIWSSDENLRFYAPRDSNVDISHSALNLQRTDRYFVAPVKSLRSIMNELGHSSIDLLKMDVEGAEHHVLEHMQVEEIWPTVVCVEFDQPCTLSQIRKQIRLLESRGYGVVAQNRWNFTLVRAGANPGRP